MQEWLTILFGAILAAVLYRMGGAEGYNTKFRDIGCPIVFLLVIWLIGQWHWLAIVSAVLMFGALTTYWDSVFGYDQFYVHGFAIGMSMAPICFVGVAWYAVLAYAAVLAVVMGLLNYAVHRYNIPYRDIIEECVRGAVIIAALPLLLL